MSFLTVSVLGARFAFAERRLPLSWSCQGPWGVAVAPPILPYNGPGWSPPFCRVPLVLRSVFYVLLCDIPPVFMAIFWLVSLTPACYSNKGLFLGHLRGMYLVGLTVLLRAIPGLLSFALAYGHASRVLIPPAIDIVWRWPCLPRLLWF